MLATNKKSLSGTERIRSPLTSTRRYRNKEYHEISRGLAPKYIPRFEAVEMTSTTSITGKFLKIR